MPQALAWPPAYSGFLEDNAVLGVASSFTGRRWCDRLDLRGAATAAEIGRGFGFPDLFARVLAGRGVDGEGVAGHLDPSIRSMLPDPFSLVDMEPAALRIADAVERGEPVAVFGDYDVDGAASAALIAGYLREAGLAVRIHIPDRLFEGYGPNVEAVRALAASGASLLITVDCGTTSPEALAEARARGMDAIVLDHHQAGAELPPAIAVVNPNRQDDLSGLGHLAACGVVFVTLVAVSRELRRRGFWAARGSEPDLLGALDLVALGTVADVVPLVGLNRAFVLKGLIALKARRRLGLRALMDAARLDGPPTPYHLGFLLGPRINAGGRIGRADLGSELLLCEDDIEAEKLAAELDRLNRERRAVETATLAEAEALAQAVAPEEGAAIVVARQGWHPGVVGLVAARLRERCERPAFAIAIDAEGIGTGSGRSMQGVDLGRAVRAAVAEGLAIKGGGHAMAAGVTLRREAVDAFRAFLAEALGAEIVAARRDRSLRIDGTITARAATAELVAQLDRAGPYGAGNPEPVVALPAHILVAADRAGEGHVRVRLQSGDGSVLPGIAFRCADGPLGAALMQARGRPVHAAGCLTIDRWGGGARVQMRIADAAAATS